MEVAFSSDSKLMASASADQTVRLWDTATGARLQILEGHTDWIIAVAFSPDSKLVASASADQTVRFWDPATGARLQTLEGYTDWINAVAFSPDSKVVASASDDMTVRLWDAATGAVLQILQVDTVIHRLSFSKDGTYLETDRGLVSIQSIYASTVSLQLQSLCNIFVKAHWVTHEMRNLLWLSPDYWPICLDVRGSILVSGHESGQVMFIEFNLSYY